MINRWTLLASILALPFVGTPGPKAANVDRAADYSACLQDRSQDMMVCIMVSKDDAPAAAMAEDLISDCRKVLEAGYRAEDIRDFLKSCHVITTYANNRWKEGFPK